MRFECVFGNRSEMVFGVNERSDSCLTAEYTYWRDSWGNGTDGNHMMQIIRLLF